MMLCLATDHFTVVNEGVLDLSEVISILMSQCWSRSYRKQVTVTDCQCVVCTI